MMADGACRIVNISSTIALTGYNGLSVYAASKAAAGGFTRSLAREVAKLDITVNAIASGFVDTELTQVAGRRRRRRIARRTALRRLTEADDVAPTVEYLLGEGGRNITGTVLPSTLATPPDRHCGRHARSPRTASPDAGSCFVRCTS
jgi:3-oxoacyl-[acyl-carrier protein] reductase